MNNAGISFGVDGAGDSKKSPPQPQPLWIRPLASQKIERSNKSATKIATKAGSYQVIQKLVTLSPSRRQPDGEIETVLEAFVSPSGECLWRRVAVWSGPSSPQRVMHASFILSSPGANALITDQHSEGIRDLLNQPSFVCWAAFPERPNHKLLCVLVNPTTLSIWDVYPDSKKVYVSGEGHSVALPFQCCSIRPLGECHGLLLQRRDDHDDLEARKISGEMDISSHHPSDYDEVDEFFLKVPPRATRMSEGSSNANNNNAGYKHQPLTPGHQSVPLSTSYAPVEVSSLFSLKHPLEDVLPVSYWSQNDTMSSLVTDAFEKIIHTATLRWTDHTDNCCKKSYYEQPICVSYHVILKRHAIWALKGAPLPATTPPLWQRSRQWRSTKDWDSHVEMLDQDLEDMELLGVMDPSLHDGPTRDEALADALGVRRTPRKSLCEVGGTRGRGLEPRSRNRAEPASVNRSGFLQNPSRSMRDGSFLDTDISHHIETTQLLNLRPLSNLHPNVAIECLFEEPSENAPALNVFLASNLEGSGLLVLGIVSPETGSEGNPNALRLFSFEPSLVDPMSQDLSKKASGSLSETLSHRFSTKILSSTGCISAQPVQATPVPLCFLPHSKERKQRDRNLATDLLILKRTSENRTCLSLHRSHCHVADCAVLSDKESDENRSVIISDIQHPVRGNVDIVQCDKGIRVHISLEMESYALAEKALLAVESSIFANNASESNTAKMEFAVKFRADCCRLDQAIRRNSFVRTAVEGDTAWAAVSCLLDAVVDKTYLKTEVGINERSSRTTKRSPWDALLSSSFHAGFSRDNQDAFFLGRQEKLHTSVKPREENYLGRLLSSIGSYAIPNLATDLSVVTDMFDSLHLVYEDLKLSSDSCRMDQLRCVGSFLVKTCFKCDSKEKDSTLRGFLNHYKKDLGVSWVSRFEEHYLSGEVFSSKVYGMESKATTFDAPPCILTWLDALVKKKESCRKSIYDTEDLSTINAACMMTRSLLRVFSILSSSIKNPLERDYEVVTALCEEGFRTADEVRDELPTGIAILLLEALNRCNDPEQASRSGWTAAEFALVGRQDLSINSGNSTLDLPRILGNNKIPVRASDPDNPSFADKDKDGIVPLQVTSAMLFPEDNRIREAGRLLRSSRPCFLSVPRAIEVSDHEYERLKQNKLLLLCRRALSLSVGRGMLTIGSFQPVAAEPLPVPDLCLVGRVPPTNANLALDMSECQSEFKVWPEFHNGVAAGLQVEGESNETISKVTRQWIVYNRPTYNESHQQNPNPSNGQPPMPANKSHAHGGLLLALGLRGHLAALEMTDIYDYLTQGQVTLTCGVLLGMAANKRGSCDISVSKMLCLHLPSLIPQHFSAIDVASPVQTAAVTGAGLLFQGSSHRMMTEFLLNEIGRRPESDITIDREAYTLSCGIALGMVNICKGDSISDGQSVGGGEGLADLRIGERLYRYIVGGTDSEEVRRMREANDRLNLPTVTASGEHERCSCVFEGDAINIDVTAAGATLALGLIFLRTGNRNIASAIAIPDTHFLLEYVRPDFLTLRVVAKALILWDDVKPTKEWIADQLPRVVRDAYKQMQSKMKTATDLGDMLEEGSDSASNMEMPRNESCVRQGDANTSRSERQSQAQDYDCQAVRQIYVHVISGACFGLGLRYAGTGDPHAAAAIFERVVELQTLRDANDSVSVAMRPELQILETCLGCCAISLAMVNAGTGDLETLKLLKILRWRCDDQVKYGTHMSYAMAIGLLFLGGGTCTLGRQPEDIAALIAAFYPRFPFTTTDNQYHLQALRHLYALAVKRRDIRFVDIDSGEVVPIPIEIKHRDPSAASVQMTTPCLLPNADGTVLEGRILSEHFYPLKFDVNSAIERTFYVKRRFESPLFTGFLGVQHSLATHAGNLQDYGVSDLPKSLSGNPFVLAFAKYICAFSSKKKSHLGASVEDFSRAVVQECLAGYSERSLPVYLKLRTSIAAIETGSTSSSLLSWDFRLMCSFYEVVNRQGNFYQGGGSLLNIEKVAYLSTLVNGLS